MRLALSLGEAALGQTGTNPAVGCVVVKGGRIVGMGAHLERGKAHAEAHALDMAGDEAEGATVYVTLEPCAHYGRTPPCAERLARAKVARVVIGAKDPNPLVAGRGIAFLRERGVDVEVGVLEEEARRLHEPFFRSIETGRPFVAVKAAMSLDGRIAAPGGDSKWITNAASRAFVQRLRHRHQAVMVGVGTVLADDPRLTVRGNGEDRAEKRQPLRIVVDSLLRTPPRAALLAPRDDGEPAAIILTTAAAPERARRELEARGAEIVVAGGGPRVDLEMALRKLYERGIGSVLAEGGGTLNGALLGRRLADRVYAFIAPKIIGTGGPSGFEFPGAERLSAAIALKNVKVTEFEGDVLVEGTPVYPADA